MRRCWQAMGLGAVMSISAASYAGCTGDGKGGGILGMDRCDEFEAKGIYSRHNQQLLNAVVIGGTLGFALWEGTESPGGRTAWQSLDSVATAGIAGELSQQYFLGYASSAPKDGRWHTIEVRVTKGGYLVRARRGFIAS